MESKSESQLLSKMETVKEISRQNILNGQDGKNGTPGKDGQTPTVETMPALDKDGKQIGVTIITRDGDGKNWASNSDEWPRW